MSNLKDTMIEYGSLVFPVDGKEKDQKCIMPIKDKETYDRLRIYGKRKNTKAKASLTWNPMSEDWKNWCKNEFWFQDTVEAAKMHHPKMDEKLFVLKEKLLSFAGEAVCLPGYEEDLENILNYGQFWLGYDLKLVKGQTCRCHANASRIWEKNKDIMTICTGYALSDDGMWRQHSWVAQKQPCMHQIIETTERRVLYFGFALTPELCEKFAENNY